MDTPIFLRELLLHPQVTDICVNAADDVHADFGRGLQPIPVPPGSWNSDQLKSWLLAQLARIGKSWDARSPYLDGTLEPEQAGGYAHRLHAVFPPLSPRGILISLRKLGRRGGPSAWSADPLFPRLCEIIVRGESLVISGATGSGKTRLAQELIAQVPSHERVVALEDTPELAPAHPHFLSLLSRTATADGFGEVTLKTLLKQTLRMRPDRIVLGECRGDEVLDLLQAMNTGHRGLLCTLHANSPRDALRRIELLCLLSGKPLAVSILRELLALGVQWIVQLERGTEGRRITELAHVEGREGDTILLRSLRGEAMAEKSSFRVPA